MSDTPRPRNILHSIFLWFCPANEKDVPEEVNNRVDWVRAIPFIGMHLGCLLVVCGLVSMLGILACGVGLLVSGPVAFGALATHYNQVFGDLASSE